MTVDLLKIVADARRLQPITKRNYARTVQQWLTFAGTDQTRWTVPVCQQFYDDAVARGISHRSANVMLAGLTFAFKRANALYGIPNIVPGIEIYKSGADRGDVQDFQHKALTAARVKALLATSHTNTLADLRDHTLILLTLYTGMRVMSLESLDVSGVTSNKGYVTLRTRLKGGSWYQVPLDVRVWEQTKKYRMKLPKDGPLFTRLMRTSSLSTQPQVGGRLTKGGIYKVMKARAEDAKLDFHPHLLRHTFVTWCRTAKVDPGLIAVVTGHKSFDPHGMVNYYTDKRAMYEQAAVACYEAITKQLGIP